MLQPPRQSIPKTGSPQVPLHQPLWLHACGFRSCQVNCLVVEQQLLRCRRRRLPPVPPSPGRPRLLCVLLRWKRSPRWEAAARHVPFILRVGEADRGGRRCEARQHSVHRTLGYVHAHQALGVLAYEVDPSTLIQ